MGAKKKTKARKEELWGELQQACINYDKALFVNTDNVTSKQICIMRREMRAIGAVMVCGKNTMMKASITELSKAPEEGEENYEERKAEYVHRPHLEKIMSQLRGNTSIIFTNNDLIDIQKILDSQVREAPAKVGSYAPKDVTIIAGPTGLDPKETGFFQKLSIATKITRAKIEIIKDFEIIKEGDKVSPGQAALLEKLKMRPFEFKMTIKKVMQDGQLYDPGVLNISTESILSSFGKGVSNITALSLGSGFVTPAAAPHLIMHSFKNLAAISFATDFKFAQAEALKAAAAAGPAVASSAPAAGGGATAAAAVEEEEPAEESDEDVGFDLFG